MKLSSLKSVQLAKLISIVMRKISENRTQQYLNYIKDLTIDQIYIKMIIKIDFFWHKSRHMDTLYQTH